MESLLLILLMLACIPLFSQFVDFIEQPKQQEKIRCQDERTNRYARMANAISDRMGFVWEHERHKYAFTLRDSLTMSEHIKYVSPYCIGDLKEYANTREIIWRCYLPLLYPIDIPNLLIKSGEKYDYSEVIKQMFVYCHIIMYRYDCNAHIVPAIEAISRILTGHSYADHEWQFASRDEMNLSWMDLYPSYMMKDSQRNDLRQCYRVTSIQQQSMLSIPQWLTDLWNESIQEFNAELDERNRSGLPTNHYSQDIVIKLTAKYGSAELYHWKYYRFLVDLERK